MTVNLFCFIVKFWQKDSSLVAFNLYKITNNSSLKILTEDQDQMSYRELGLKAQSKKELYHLLTTDIGIYLPSIQEANAKYLSDVLGGAKNISLLIMMHIT